MKKHYPTAYSSPEAYLEGEYERLLDQKSKVNNYSWGRPRLKMAFSRAI